MTSTIHQMYKNLEKCTESLEQDVEQSLRQLHTEKTVDENFMALEASKDYHYKEILNHLKQIKDHIKVIAEHNQSIQSIQAKNRGSSKIDKNYIKKQVETFQNMGVVNRREHKPVRPPETSSMKLLECWEEFLDQQEEDSQTFPTVVKREETLRKKKKIISSTVDAFLESDKPLEFPEESIEEEGLEAINEEVVNVPEDTKPRIVEVIYKKDANV